MNNFFLSMVLICLGTSTLLGQNLQTDRAGTAISFSIKNFGMNVKGTFSDFKVDANFEQNNIENSYFSGSAIIQSIDTGIDGRDNSLQGKKYFHSEQYPEITLVSYQLKKSGDGNYEFTGTLNIKGVTKSITFPIKIEKTSNDLVAKGDFEINRLDFDVGESSWVMQKKVIVSIVYKGNFK